MADRPEMEHLELKAMRLSPPGTAVPATEVPEWREGEDLPISSSDSASDPRIQVLSLPATLAKVLVGETFHGYIHLMNVTEQPVSQVILRVDVTLDQERTVLFTNAQSPVVRLEPGQHYNAIIRHQLRRQGTYVLTCNAAYTPMGTGETRTFKRSFRFPAIPAFEVKHTVAPRDSRLFVESRVECVAPTPVYLKSSHVVASEDVKVEPLTLVGDGNPASQKGSFMKPGDVVSYVNVLQSTLGTPWTPSTPVNGNLCLAWRTCTGGVGFFSEWPITFKPAQPEPEQNPVVKGAPPPPPPAPRPPQEQDQKGVGSRIGKVFGWW